MPIKEKTLIKLNVQRTLNPFTPQIKLHPISWQYPLINYLLFKNGFGLVSWGTHANSRSWTIWWWIDCCCSCIPQWWHWCWGWNCKQRDRIFSEVSFLNEIGILLPKLFWPTVRKNCSSDQKSFWNSRLKAENFQKFWGH